MRKQRTRKPRKRSNRRLKSVITRVIRSQDERKTVDVSITDNTPIQGAAVVTYLTTIIQGAGSVDQRIGNKISLISIQLRGDILSNNTVAAERGACRIMLVRAITSVKGTLPIITDILKSNQINSLRMIEKQMNYKVLWDKTYYFNAFQALKSLIKPINKFISLNGLKCTFNSNSGAIGGSETGGLFLIRQTTETAGNQQTWELNTRITYKEF